MKEYFLYVDEKTLGPLSQEEIEAKIKSGEFEPDVLIAGEGDDDWKPAKDVLKIRTGVRLSRKSKEEEEKLRAAREAKLDPDVRKKLMLYGLADAISVDKFTPEQAQQAITTYEKNLAKQKYTKIGAGVGAFVVVFGALFGVLSKVKLSNSREHVDRNLLAPIAELLKSPNEEFRKQKIAINAEIATLQELREQTDALEFKLPSGKDSRQVFLSNVEIPAGEQKILTGSVQITGFDEVAVPEDVEVEDVKIFFATKVGSDVNKILQKEIELLKLLKSPLWSDAELSQKALEELAPLLPQPDGAKSQAGRLLERLGKVQVGKIQEEVDEWTRLLESEVRRQDSRGELHLPVEMERLKTRRAKMSKELHNQLNSSKTKDEIEKRYARGTAAKNAVITWALRQMPEFLDKFENFVEEHKFSYSQEARLAAWNEFKTQNTGTLKKAFEPEKGEFFTLDENGKFKLFRRDARGLAVQMKVGDEIIELPAPFNFQSEKDSVPVITVSDIDVKNVKPEDVLMDEKYRIVEKISVGGKPYFRKGKLLGHTVSIYRYSPVLNYISVVKLDPNSKKTKPIILQVEDENEFASYEVDGEVPIENLLKMPHFTKPAEASAPSGITLVQPKEAEALAAKNAAKNAAEKAETPAEEEKSEAPEEEKSESAEEESESAE